MLESARIVTVCNDHDDRVIGQLTYGEISPTTGRPNAVRSYTEDYIELRPSVIPLIDKLLEVYPYCAKPFPEDELYKRFNNVIVVDMYSFYPPELLHEIGMDTKEDKAIAEMLKIASDINYYSHEETEGGIKFEYALTDAFNMFADVEAERVGGAGYADIECVYIMSATERIKFDIESNYAIGVLRDIDDADNTVIIKSTTLANYFYQYILK